MDVILQVSELKFATGEGVLILDRVSFGVTRDGVALLVGPASSGKTLLIKLLLREVSPTGGQILMLGRNVARLPSGKISQLRRRVGYMPETPPILWDRPVLENLEFKLRALATPREEMPDLITRAIQLAGLDGEEETMAAELPPLGQRQLALALAMSTEPPLLLSDDPLRELERGEQVAMVELLDGVRRAGTALVVTAREPEPARRLVESTPQGVLVRLRQEAVL
ncbi:MAG: ATP-binding cassette domain-containing protein [Candidatus Bipolaricaulota bacterium]